MQKLFDIWDRHRVSIIETILVIGIVCCVCFLARGWNDEYSKFDNAVLIDESSAEYLYFTVAASEAQTGTDRSLLYEYVVDGQDYRFAVKCKHCPDDINVSTCPIRISKNDPTKILIDMNWFTAQSEPNWVAYNKVLRFAR